MFGRARINYARKYPAEELGATRGKSSSLRLINTPAKVSRLVQWNSGSLHSRKGDGKDGPPWTACRRIMLGELFSGRTGPVGLTRPVAFLVLTVANSSTWEPKRAFPAFTVLARPFWTTKGSSGWGQPTAFGGTTLP